MDANIIANLCQDIAIPKMVKVKQHFDPSYIAPEDIPQVIWKELDRDIIAAQIKSGMSIAITCGSRGVANIDIIIKAVVDYTISQQKAMYDTSLTVADEDRGATTMVEDDDYEEPLYNEIREFVITQGKASASLLQRRFRLGYNRAARCIDLLEERGIVGPPNGAKPREVLVKLEKKDE